MRGSWRHQGYSFLFETQAKRISIYEDRTRPDGLKSGKEFLQFHSWCQETKMSIFHGQKRRKKIEDTTLPHASEFVLSVKKFIYSGADCQSRIPCEDLSLNLTT